MKRLVALAGALCTLALAAPLAQAQGGGRPRLAETLMKGITLTPVEKTKVDSIAVSYRKQMMDIGGMGEGPPDSTKMARRRDLMDKQTAELRAVLTPDQQASFDKNAVEWREEMAKRRHQN